ncbi:MAG: hypothetical protein HY863_15620 [Chloroflexi bacterium]|nr:hypothetical protein [Chloroflexota bacterium]
MNNMVKTYLFVLLVIILAGCAPTATQQMDLYGTAIVAQQQVEVSGLMLTGTAQAPIWHITETRAAFDMAQAYAVATDEAGIKTATVAFEQTQASYTATPSPTPTPNATSTIVAAQVVAIQTSINLDTRKKEISNNFWAVILPIFLLSILLVLAFVGIFFARQNRYKVHKGENGDKPLIGDLVTGEWIDVDANPNYSTGKNKSVFDQAFEQWLERKFGFVPQLPHVTAARQDAVKERDQFIDLNARVARLPKQLVDSQGMKFLPAPGLDTAGRTSAYSTTDGLFPRPDWSIIKSWDGKGGLPYGLSARGLETMDLNLYPHVGTIGKTGSGKSRRFLRPFLACALAAGQRVVIIGKQVDYWPFATHVNATILPVRELTMEDEAKKYAFILRKMVEEMNRRDMKLTTMHKSTWSIAGMENTLIVLDELGNALDLMPREFAEESYRYIRGLVKEGRKVGFNIVFSSQRAKGFRDVMTQVGRAVFFVEDEMESRHALGVLGAEQLSEGYFYAKFGSMKLTGSFEPSDEELTEFLRSRQVKALERQDWIEGEITPIETEQAAGPAEAGLYPPEIKQILELHSQGRSPTAIIWELWKVSGGSTYMKRLEQVKSLITSTTSGGMTQNRALEV